MHILSLQELWGSGSSKQTLNFFSTVYTKLATKQKPFGRKSTFTTWGPLQLAGDQRKECRVPGAKRNLESQISCVPTQQVTIKPAATDSSKSNLWHTVNNLPTSSFKINTPGTHVALIWGIISKHTVAIKLAGQNWEEQATTPQVNQRPWFSYLQFNTQHAGRFAQ